jgi:hypothetical protein
LRDDASASHHHDVRTGLLLQVADLRRQIALQQCRIVPCNLVELPGKHELAQIVHPLGDDRITLRGKRGRPEIRHQLIGHPAEQKLAAAARVLGDKGLPFRIVLVGPVHVTVGVGKISIERH